MKRVSAENPERNNEQEDEDQENFTRLGNRDGHGSLSKQQIRVIETETKLQGQCEWKKKRETGSRYIIFETQIGEKRNSESNCGGYEVEKYFVLH